MKLIPSRWRSRTVWFFFLLSCSLMAQRLSSQTQMEPFPHPAEFNVVSGRVVNVVTADPVKRVRVTLRAINTDPQSTYNLLTDGEGRFSFTSIPLGKYEVQAVKKGFLPPDTAISQSRSADITLELTANASPLLIIRLIPMSVIVGHVFDIEGEPVVDAAVEATPAGSSGQAAKGARASTNDLGEYRLYGLTPGEYYVSAIPNSARASMPRRTDNPSGAANYVRTFYPRTLDTKAAQVVALRPGGQASDVDIQLIKTTPHVLKIIDLTAHSSEPQNVNAINVATEPASNSEHVDPRKLTSVTGRVLNARNGAPVRHAQVMLLSLVSGDGIPYVTDTDSNGAFRVGNLEVGDYRLAVLRDGFLPLSTSTGEGRLLRLQSGTAARNVIVRISPCSVIAGTVFDDESDPVSEMHVEALRIVYSNGKRQMRVQATASTDDLGRYRLYGLAPGDYYVKASATQSVRLSTSTPNNSASQYVSSYYPRAADIGGAAVVNVRAGDQVPGIDIWAENRSAATVAGRVLSPDGGPISRDAVISLTPLDQSENSFLQTADVKDSAGHFEIRGVPPGAYVIFSMWRRGGSEFAGSRSIEVHNSDITDLQIGMSSAVNTTGMIGVPSDTGIKFENLRVLLQPETEFPTGSLVGNLRADATFTLHNVLPERYSLKVFGVPQVFYISAVELGNQPIEGRIVDFTRGVAPLHIFLGKEGGVLTGSVLRDQDQPVSGAKVVLVPNGTNATAHDLYKAVASARDGTFKIVGIAPGEYTLFAWEHVDAEAYFDPEFLAKSQDFGRRVIIRQNSSQMLNVTVIPVD